MMEKSSFSSFLCDENQKTKFEANSPNNQMQATVYSGHFF